MAFRASDNNLFGPSLVLNRTSRANREEGLPFFENSVDRYPFDVEILPAREG